MSTTGERFERAVAIMERLRAPGGCPWDREQTYDSIKPYTLEETYEVLEAIDNRDWDELPGELGDLLLQVLFYSEMAKEQGTFSIDDVLDRLSSKLVDRHPHVFGDVKADTSSEVKRNWEALKVEERKKRFGGIAEATAGSAAKAAPRILAGISSSMPSLLEAHKLSSRAAQVGFDWPNMEGLFEKLSEETSELREHLREFPAPGPRPEGRGVAGSGRQTIPEDLRARLEGEVGDLFSCWSTSHATSRSIPNPRCARRTASSAAALNGWSNGCTSAAPIQKVFRWRNWNPSGSRRNNRRSPREPGRHRDSALQGA